MDGETCIDGHPRGMGFVWRGESCQIGDHVLNIVKIICNSDMSIYLFSN